MSCILLNTKAKNLKLQMLKSLPLYKIVFFFPCDCMFARTSLVFMLDGDWWNRVGYVHLYNGKIGWCHVELSPLITMLLD